MPRTKKTADAAVEAAEVKETKVEAAEVAAAPAKKTTKTSTGIKKTTTSTGTAAAKKTAAASKELDFEEIVTKFRASVAKAKAPADLRIAAQITLTGSVEGILYVLVANGYAVVEGFDYKDADIDMDADADAFYAVVTGKKDIAAALNEGTVKMQGNAGVGIQLAKVVF